MKLDRVLVARLDSVGYPASRQYVQGDAKQLAAKIVVWLAQVTLGTRIEITIADNREALEGKIVRPKEQISADQMMEELERIIGEEEAKQLTLTRVSIDPSQST